LFEKRKKKSRVLKWIDQDSDPREQRIWSGTPGKGEAMDLRAFLWMKEESEERQREELMMMERNIECRGIRNVYITFGSVVD